MATNGQSPAPYRLINSEAESSATSNSLPPTMRSKTSRPDLSVMQLRSTPSTATSPSRMASIRSYRQHAKVSGRRDTALAAQHPDVMKADQRLENWNERRALALPHFFRSTTPESRVKERPCLASFCMYFGVSGAAAGLRAES